MRRVLFLTYTFPPSGGAGVQRVVKFVKYLPSTGWIPTVITVSNPSVPVHDDSLLSDVPAGLEVRRVKTWEPRYAVKALVSANRETAASRSPFRSAIRRFASLALQPDPQILFVPNAIRAGRALLAADRYDAILATAPPFSVFIAGVVLSRRSGVPLVLDYRDEWDITNSHSENRRNSALSNGVQRRMQTRIVKAAKGIIATTKRSAEALQSVRDAAGSSATVTWIYNGFDPDDFAGTATGKDAVGKKFRLSYVGTLWNLTSALPLVLAVSCLTTKYPHLAADLELVLAGRRTAEQEALVTRLRTMCRLVEKPYIEHSQAVELMKSSDALCLLLSDLPEASRCVPAKLFEYMAAGSTILAVTPPGEVEDLLSNHPCAYVCRPDDPEGFADLIAVAIDRKRRNVGAIGAACDISSFSRRAQTAKLASFLETIAAGGECSGS